MPVLGSFCTIFTPKYLKISMLFKFVSPMDMIVNGYSESFKID